MLPRAVFTKHAPSGRSSNALAPTMPLVDSSKGTCTVSTSLLLSNASNDPTNRKPCTASIDASGSMSYPSTSPPKLVTRRATWLPMRPTPNTPTDTSSRWRPINRLRFHDGSPPSVRAVPSGTRRSTIRHSMSA